MQGGRQTFGEQTLNIGCTVCGPEMSNKLKMLKLNSDLQLTGAEGNNADCRRKCQASKGDLSFSPWPVSSGCIAYEDEVEQPLD